MTAAQGLIRIFYNGKFITLDERVPEAEAMAVAGDRILAVGSYEELKAIAGRWAEVHDLGGQVAVPGFNDSHMHLINLGQGMDGVDLSKARSVSDLVRLGQEYLRQNQDRAWIIGRFTERLCRKELPAKEDLDRISRSACVFLVRGHIAR